MKISYFNSSNNEELDVVNLTEDSVSYRTGAARDLVESTIDHYGPIGAMEILKSSSNGYMSTRVVD